MSTDLKQRTLDQQLAYHEGFADALRAAEMDKDATLDSIEMDIATLKDSLAARGQPQKPEWYVKTMGLIRRHR